MIGPPRPDGIAPLWDIFRDLSAARGWSDWGAPQAIQWTELDAYVRLTRAAVTVAELHLLRRLDGEYRAVTADAANGQDGGDNENWDD